MSIELKILGNIINDEQYARKVVPFIKPEYFQDNSERIVFNKINEFVNKYSTIPSADALSVELENDNTLTENDFANSVEVVKSLKDHVIHNERQWLVDKTEKFCQEKAVYNAIMQSIHIIDGKGKQTKDAIPSILSDALGVSFDNHIGHDFLDDFNERYDFYHRVEEKISFDLNYFNTITKGGVSKKSLNIILAGTGVGKSLAMCHFAANNLMNGKNVLYITMEMAEEKIAERIDANLLDIPLDQLTDIPKPLYEKKIQKLRDRTPGKLIIKEYPTASAHAGHFRHLVNELKVKKGFAPDIIYIDYLNICASARMKGLGGSVNTYSYVKAIAEELRGLAVEKNVPIWSATQTTRSGYTSSDIGLEDTSESFGLPATADFMVAIISTEDLQQLDQLMVKQLKNRYNDPTINKRFVIGVDRSRMKLYDVEDGAQKNVLDGPIMDRSSLMDEDDETPRKKFDKKDFKKLFQ